LSAVARRVWRRPSAREVAEDIAAGRLRFE
jgi:hypothetical protein